MYGNTQGIFDYALSGTTAYEYVYGRLRTYESVYKTALARIVRRWLALGAGAGWARALKIFRRARTGWAVLSGTYRH